jgi:hypothetical protein
MASFKAEIVTHHFVETASINRQSRKVTRYHNQGMQGTPLPCDNAASATRDRRIGVAAAGGALEKS